MPSAAEIAAFITNMPAGAAYTTPPASDGMGEKLIWKFPLDVADRQVVAMPAGAQILTAQVQGPAICLWALVDPNQPPQPRPIYVFGTGHHTRSEEGGLAYIATVQLHGALMFHVFEGQSHAN